MQRLATALDLDETAVLHLALRQLSDRVLPPRYAPDDAELTAVHMDAIHTYVQPELPTGRKPIASLFEVAAG